MDSLPPKTESPFLDWLDAFKQENPTAKFSRELEDALLRAWLSGRLYQMHRMTLREYREKGHKV